MPLLVCVPSEANAIGTTGHQLGQIRKSLDIIDNRRLAKHTANRRERRPRTRHASLTLDTANQSRLFATDKCTGTHLHDNLKIKTAAENIFAKQPIGFRLSHRDIEPLNGKRIFGTDIDIGLRRTNAIRRNRHTLKQTMRVAFNNRTIHERAGVALIGVADQILLIPFSISGEPPLLTGREPAAAATTKTALLHFVANLLGTHRLKHLRQRLISAASDVFFDAHRRNMTAIRPEPNEFAVRRTDADRYTASR